MITGEGLKTLDAVREGFEMAVIDPTLEAFEAGAEIGGNRRRLRTGTHYISRPMAITVKIPAQLARRHRRRG